MYKRDVQEMLNEHLLLEPVPDEMRFTNQWYGGTQEYIVRMRVMKQENCTGGTERRMQAWWQADENVWFEDVEEAAGRLRAEVADLDSGANLEDVGGGDEGTGSKPEGTENLENPPPKDLADSYAKKDPWYDPAYGGKTGSKPEELEGKSWSGQNWKSYGEKNKYYGSGKKTKEYNTGDAWQNSGAGSSWDDNKETNWGTSKEKAFPWKFLASPWMIECAAGGHGTNKKVFKQNSCRNCTCRAQIRKLHV